jgi:hypothetical protein
MPQVGFESTISVLERSKTVHALDCAIILIGLLLIITLKKIPRCLYSLETVNLRVPPRSIREFLTSGIRHCINIRPSAR